MKVAFSTLGCPDWDWQKICQTAKSLGMDGIEIRGVADELYAPHAAPFREENLEQTKANLKQDGLAISILSSAANLGLPEADQAIAQAKDYIDLAHKLEVPYVRVMTTVSPLPVEGENLEQCRRLFSQLCDYAAPKGVDLLIETNGELGNSEVMAEFMQAVDAPNAGVLWDIHHPYRFFEEDPADTFSNIGKWVKYVHLKDSVGNPCEVEYRMMGFGDLPVLDIVRMLKKSGYEGYLSLEWVKRWCPDLQEPSLVFSHFAQYMRCLFGQL